MDKTTLENSVQACKETTKNALFDLHEVNYNE